MQLSLASGVNNAKWSDLCARNFGIFSTLLVWLGLGTFFTFIAFKGFYGISQYGFSNIFLSSKFSLSSSGGASFWAPFGVTFILSVLVAVITIPIATKCSVWLSFYCPENLKKLISTLFILFANLPSIVLGLFVRKYLAFIVQKIFFLESSFNIATAIVALVLMILPLIVLIFNSVLENKSEFITAASMLGMDKNYAIYRVLMPKVRKTIFVAVTLVTGRVFSESMMLSLLLSSQNYSAGFKGGVFGFFNSQLSSVSSLISENFYADGTGKNVQDLMFLFGLLLLMISLAFNSLCTPWINKDHDIDYSKMKAFMPFFYVFDLLRIKDFFYRFIHGKNFVSMVIFFRRFMETFSIVVFSMFMSSFLCSTVSEGIIAISKWPSWVPNEADTLYRALLNTLLIVSLTVFSSIPFALFMAFYLSEYRSNPRFRKYTLSLISAAASTPSIIYGIFGLSFFINILGLTAEGRNGRSILAGVLTLSFLILPYLTHLFYTHLSSIPNHYRVAARMLGVCKFHIFAKILLPIATSNLIFSILLAMGKVIGETAPLYLTAGINSVPGESLLMYQGQTLTTRLYSKIFDVKLQEREKGFGETTFFCILLLGALIFIGKYFIPYLQGIYEKHGSLREWLLSRFKWRALTLFWCVRKCGLVN